MGNYNFPLISIAHAKVTTYVGVDTAMCDFGEGKPEIVNMAQC